MRKGTSTRCLAWSQLLVCMESGRFYAACNDAIIVIAALAGAFGAFIQKRGLDLDAKG